MYWNPRSVRDKKEEISEMIQDIDILVCVESWLKEYDNFQFSGFNTLRKDRQYTTGEGIVFLIRISYNYTLVNNIQNVNTYTELYGIEITNLNEPILIIACYKPPHIVIDEQEWNLLLNYTKIKRQCILFGDFNSHNATWNCDSTDNNGELLLKQSEKHNLFLHNNNTYTQVNIQTNTKSNIDLIFSTINIAHLLKVKVSDDSRGSDHFPIYIEFDTDKYYYHKRTFKIQSKRTNWCKVTEILDENYGKFLNSDYDNLSTLDKYDMLIKIITDSVAKSTPKRKQFNNKNHRNPVAWWDSDCDRVKRQRQAA